MDPQESTVKQKASQDDEHSMIGSRVGSAFVITGLLGSGAMGNVYRASQETIGRDVAIKFLPVEIASDATAVQRLTREAKALGLLNHPGIVTTFDFGFTAKSEPYLVLELVDGKSLQAILDKETTMSPARALPIFVQICEAMSYAHGQGIIHRDLKPLNIMVGKRDQVEFAKILDFGIVKLTSESQQLTKSGEIWGSPFYMSPEQCVGGQVDNRSDIYSLGCVMFRVLTGEVPHRGASFPETIARKLSEYPLSFATISPNLNIPERLEAVVLKCLRKNSDERYASMQELRSELLKLYPDRKTSEATLTFETMDAMPSEPDDPVKEAAKVAARAALALAITNQTPTKDNNLAPAAAVIVTEEKDRDEKEKIEKQEKLEENKSSAVAQNLAPHTVNSNSNSSSNSNSTSSSNIATSKDSGAGRLVMIVVTVTLLITGFLVMGLFMLYQYVSTHQSSVKPVVTAGPAVNSAVNSSANSSANSIHLNAPVNQTNSNGTTNGAQVNAGMNSNLQQSTLQNTQIQAQNAEKSEKNTEKNRERTKSPPIMFVDSTPLRLVKRKPRLQAVTEVRQAKVRRVAKHSDSATEDRPRRRHSWSSDPNAFYSDFGGR